METMQFWELHDGDFFIDLRDNTLCFKWSDYEQFEDNVYCVTYHSFFACCDDVPVRKVDVTLTVKYPQ